jgi:outer membrane biosynthesis protein TonB
VAPEFDRRYSASCAGASPICSLYIGPESRPSVAEGANTGRGLGKPRTTVDPKYPPAAKAADVQGAAHLVANTAINAVVRDVQVDSGDPLLIAAAVNAVKRWVFPPALLNGVPVEAAHGVAVNFSLPQEDETSLI